MRDARERATEREKSKGGELQLGWLDGAQAGSTAGLVLELDKVNPTAARVGLSWDHGSSWKREVNSGKGLGVSESHGRER